MEAMKSFIKRSDSSGVAAGVVSRGMNPARVLRLLVLLCALCLISPTALAREDIGRMREVFSSLQCPALEILKRTTRLDMLDYWDADSVYKASNAMEGLSWIEEATPDYLRVRLTPVSLLEMKLLPVKKGNVVMTVYTVGDSIQAQDSQVDFYDEALRPLDRKKYFSPPGLQAFFDIPKGSLTSMKEIKEMIPFPTVAYSASPGSDSLKARLTVGEYMSVDDYNIVKLFLLPEIELKWTGRYR